MRLSPMRNPMPATLRVLAACALALLLVPATSRAGGFSISEVGARESGRGTAAAALADSPAAIFYNPANIAPQPGLRLQLGAAGLVPQWTHTDLESGVQTNSNAGISTPPHFAASYNLGDVAAGDLALGVGVFVPYGSAFSWPDTWAGRSEIQEISLQVIEIAPTLAWQPHKMFAVGASFRYLPASVYMKQAVQFGGAQEGTVAMSGSGSGMGAAVGVSFFPREGLSVALAWRSRVVLGFDGESDLDFAPPFDTQAIDRDAKTSIALPHNFRLGLAWQPVKALSLSADLEYQGWSSFKELAITFVNPDGTEEVSASPRGSADSWVFHIGGEYRLHENFALRAGYIFDQHTLPEETVNPAPPDSDRHIITLGASVYYGRFGAHLNFSDVIFAQRTSTTAPFPGQWQGAYPGNTMAYSFGLSLSADFDFGGSSSSPENAAPVAAAPQPTPTPTPAPAVAETPAASPSL